MKNLIAFLMIMSITFTFAQNEPKVEYKKDGDLTIATYYHENGNIEQQGAFNAEGQLHGVWKSYDTSGNKISMGNYINGKRNGKWLFWQNDMLREVDYLNSKVLSVNEWTDRERVAVNK